MKDLKHFAGSGLNAACLSLAWLLLIVSVGAQTGQGTITGTVRDRANAVIPGAEVTLTQTATNIVREEVTRADGVYYFGSLPIGKYDLDVVVTGFRPVKSELLVQVGQQTLLDVVLEVGAMTDTISVTAAAPLTPTETAEVSDIKDYDRIRQLPLNGRSVSTLFDLTPGIEGGGNARVNGLKVGSLEITLDGVSLVDRYGGGIARVQPGLDIVQEFRVETVGSDARYSRPATVILATRSGTNEFHGSAFETHRNNAAGLLARRRETTGSFNPPKLIRNEFGISAGGPLFLPRLGEGGKPYLDGRNKTFWFVAYEGLRSRQSLLTNASTPTAAMWNGNLSLPVDANGNRLTAGGSADNG
ncbi:MAG: carboxypeptidase-like regulatory domain-containing protein [Blastocatellia bacterium]